MLTALIVSVSLTVPYLPQTDALCGGAATAMVLRYWGDAHAGVDEFAPLVDRRAGGIAGDVLAKAIAAKGWSATVFAGSVERLQDEMQQQHPVIVLVADGSTLYHYLVVTAIDADRVVVHDPAWGPSRTIPLPQFLRIWSPARFWSLLILPRDGTTRRFGVASENAAALPTAVPGSIGELAGIRFAEHQWAQAAKLAGEAVVSDPTDRYAWDVLGSSRFMQDDLVGALRAWNQIEKPRIDLVEIDGVRHARYQTISGALGLAPNALLTADAFRLADRRLNDLPDRALSRLSYAPGLDGFATVRAAIVERSGPPHGAADWAVTGLRTAVDREVRADLPGPSGQGGLWTASWRWWPNRPQVALAFAAPRVDRFGGVWRVDGSWDSQAYATSPLDSFTEVHAHGGLTVSNWATPDLRYSITGGFDRWRVVPTDLRAGFVGGSIERRWLGERFSTSGQATAWLPTSGQSAFAKVALRVAFNSRQLSSGWTYIADIGAEHATAAAPLGVWPGAGDGYIRVPLLRAHPLLEDGVVQLGADSVFGRTVSYANVEAQRWLVSSSLVRVGIAGFTDVGTAVHGTTLVQVDLGIGARLRIPKAVGTLRIDVARGLDGAHALTVGWQF